jgi:hypothetical protein
MLRVRKQNGKGALALSVDEVAQLNDPAQRRAAGSRLFCARVGRLVSAFPFSRSCRRHRLSPQPQPLSRRHLCCFSIFYLLVNMEEAAQLCVSKYSEIGPKGKPNENEWTILAGFVLVSNNFGPVMRVISIGTGSKCVNFKKTDSHGVRLPAECP